MAGVLALAAARRSRIATATAAFITAFGPWGAFFVAGAGYVLFAFLLLRAGRQMADGDRRGPRR